MAFKSVRLSMISHHDRVRRDVEVAHHRIGNVLHQCAFLLDGAAFDRMDVDFRHWRPPLLVAGQHPTTDLGPITAHTVPPTRRPVTGGPCGVAQIGYWWWQQAATCLRWSFEPRWSPRELVEGKRAMLELVPNLQRLGTETAFEVLARAAELQRRGKDVINLGIGQPDFQTPQHIVDAAIKALRDGHHGYTPAQGILPLREAVAADLARRHDVEVDPDASSSCRVASPPCSSPILMFGQPGAEIMYPDPGFPIYRSMIQYTGAKPVPIALLARKTSLPSPPSSLGAGDAEDQPDHPQQPEQSLRRRGAGGGGEASRLWTARSTRT